MTYRPETLAVHAGQEQPGPASNSRAVQGAAAGTQ